MRTDRPFWSRATAAVMIAHDCCLKSSATTLGNHAGETPAAAGGLRLIDEASNLRSPSRMRSSPLIRRGRNLGRWSLRSGRTCTVAS